MKFALKDDRKIINQLFSTEKNEKEKKLWQI